MISKPYISALTIGRCNFDTTRLDNAPPIHAACSFENIETVANLLSQGADVNARDKQGRTPVFYTVMNRHLFHRKVFDYLVSQGADIHAKDFAGRSLLHEAGFMANAPAAQHCLDLGMDVDIRDNQGWTPLIESCYTSDLDMIQDWIQWGADVNAKSLIGETPLGVAIAKENPGAAFLVWAGADLELDNPKGALTFPVPWELEATVQAILERAQESIPSLAHMDTDELLRLAQKSSLFDIFSRHQRAEAIKNDLCRFRGIFRCEPSPSR